MAIEPQPVPDSAAAPPTDAAPDMPPDGDGLTLARLAGLLGQAVRESPALAAAVRAIGEWMLSLGASASPGVEPSASATMVESAADAAAVQPAGRVPSAASAPVERRVDTTLTLGGAPVRVSVRADGSALRPVTVAESLPTARETPRVVRAAVDLSIVIRRTRLKAECCRWAIERRKRLRDGADFDQLIRPTDSDLAARLRTLPDCYAWPIDPYLTLPDDRRLDDAAGCYDTLADAVELARRVRENDSQAIEDVQSAYYLLAESCSALRKILLDCGIEKDADQNIAFDWLRTRAFEEQIYVNRHMRLNDPADPSKWADRREKIQKVLRSIQDRLESTKEISHLINRVGYIAKHWIDYSESERVVQFGKLDVCVTRLVELGLRPSDPRLRDALLLIADEIPERLEIRGVTSEALRYADEYAAQVEAEAKPVRSAAPALIPEVQQARRLLENKVVVMIGGVCRPRSRDALCDALGLAELRWVATRPHESLDNFESQVRRADVALVMLAIRWSSHSFEEIKSVCDAAGKPFVRLPRGYGVNQVAREIVAQVSETLARRA